MHKGLIGGIAVLALVGAGFGGCYVLDNKVRTAVQAHFDDFSKSSPLITSARFEGLDVDFFADELKLHKVQVDLDVSQFPEFTQTMPEGLVIKGTSTQTAETMTVKGIREIMFGGNIIRQIDADDIKTSANLTESFSFPEGPQQENLTDQEQLPQSKTISIVMNGALPHAEVYGFDLSQLNKATTEVPLPYKVGSYEAKDLQVSLDIKQTAEAMKDSLTDEPKPVPALHGDITIARITGSDVSNAYIGAIHYENTVFKVSDTDNLKEPVTVKMAELSITDTKIVDMMPLRSTMEIKGLEFDTSKMDNPKGKVMMAMLGVDQINLNLKTSYDFDPDRHTLNVSAFRFGLKQAGNIDVNFALSGLPSIDEIRKLDDLQKALMQAQAQAPASAPEQEQVPQQAPEQTPEMVQAQAEMKAMFKDLSIAQIALQYQDEGVLKKFLGFQAMKYKAEPAQLAEAYAQQAAKIITATHGPETAEKAQKVLVAFLTDPDALRVELKSTSPVNLQGLSEQVKASGPMALKAFELDVQGGTEALAH